MPKSDISSVYPCNYIIRSYGNTFEWTLAYNRLSLPSNLSFPNSPFHWPVTPLLSSGQKRGNHYFPQQKTKLGVGEKLKQKQTCLIWANMTNGGCGIDTLSREIKSTSVLHVKRNLHLSWLHCFYCLHWLHHHTAYLHVHCSLPTYVRLRKFFAERALW